MRPKIIVTDGFHAQLFSELQAIEKLEVYARPKVTAAELDALLSTANGLVIRSETKITPELLQQAPKLRYVIRAGEGTDNINIQKCNDLGVHVSNTPGANNNSAAEHAIALMMSVLRKTPAAHATMKEGKWEKTKFTGNELWKKKIGIVGFGRIGQIVAQRLAGFEVEVLFYDPFLEKSSIPYATKAKDLETLFSSCDVVTLHTPYMKETAGLVNAHLLNLMRPDSILINASRGGIVDEKALYVLLKEEKIRGAGFDVFATEPLEESHELRSLNNLVMTPHLGASTEEAQYRVGEMVIHQLQEFFINDVLLNEVKA